MSNIVDARLALLTDIYKTNFQRTQHRRVPKQTHNIRTQCFHVANENSSTTRYQGEQRNCRFSIIFILSLQIASKKIHPHQLSSSSHYNKTTLVKNSNHLLLANFQSCEFVMGIYSSCGSTNSSTSQKPKQDQWWFSNDLVTNSLPLVSTVASLCFKRSNHNQGILFFHNKTTEYHEVVKHKAKLFQSELQLQPNQN